jgi:hypothetical protein
LVEPAIVTPSTMALPPTRARSAAIDADVEGRATALATPTPRARADSRLVAAAGDELGGADGTTTVPSGGKLRRDAPVHEFAQALADPDRCAHRACPWSIVMRIADDGAGAAGGHRGLKQRLRWQLLQRPRREYTGQEVVTWIMSNVAGQSRPSRWTCTQRHDAHGPRRRRGVGGNQT